MELQRGPLATAPTPLKTVLSRITKELAWDGSVVGMPGSTVFAHRIAIDPSLVHKVFLSFGADPFVWRPVSIDFEVDQSSFTKALCLLHQCPSAVVFVAWRPHELDCYH